MKLYRESAGRWEGGVAERDERQKVRTGRFGQTNTILAHTDRSSRPIASRAARSNRDALIGKWIMEKKVSIIFAKRSIAA